jgi:hypothetical protein
MGLLGRLIRDEQPDVFWQMLASIVQVFPLINSRFLQAFCLSLQELHVTIIGVPCMQDIYRNSGHLSKTSPYTRLF